MRHLCVHIAHNIMWSQSIGSRWGGSNWTQVWNRRSNHESVKVL